MSPDEATKEPQGTCSRCGKAAVLTTYKPNLGKHPGKTVDVCEPCASADPKLLRDVAVEVPAIEPAVPKSEAGKVVPFEETKVFNGTRPEPIKINTPHDAPPVEPQPEAEPEPEKEEVPVSTEPVSRDDIRKQLAEHEQAHNKLVESRARLQNQFQQVNALINTRRGAIATLRGLLGNEETADDSK